MAGYFISIMSLRFICAVCVIVSLLFFQVPNTYLCVNMTHFTNPFIIPLDGHLGWFCFLVIMSNAALNVGIALFVQIYTFISLWYIPRSEISGWYGYSMFNIFGNCTAVFQNVWTTLHIYQWCMRVPICLYPHHHLSFCFKKKL